MKACFDPCEEFKTRRKEEAQQETRCEGKFYRTQKKRPKKEYLLCVNLEKKLYCLLGEEEKTASTV
jgi:hypothetical protein